MTGKEFKHCTFCGKIWEKRADFIQDKDIDIIGYQADFECLEEGLFYFNHRVKKCNTTLAITVQYFLDLFQGEIPKVRSYGTKKCPGLCMYKDKLDTCPNDCECSYVRTILKIIKEYPKK